MSLGMQAPASKPGPWGIATAFLVYSAVFVLLKGDYPHFLEQLQTARGLENTAPRFDCGQINTCMRVAVTTVGYILTAVFTVAADLLFGDPQASLLLGDSPWGTNAPTHGDKLIVIRSLTFYPQRVVFLLPLLWLCLVFYRRAAHGFLFLTLLFVALAGWPMAVLDGFFRLLGSVADWPLAYYVFGARLQPYDFRSVGYAIFLCLYIARREPIRLWQCAALTVAGQLIFENYGVVTGIALFAATLLADRRQAVPSRLWLASRRLAVAGAASVVLAGLFAIIHAGLATGLTAAAAPAETPLAVLMDYFASHWQNFGRTNFSWFNVIVANVISLVSIPLILGVGFGAVVALTDRNLEAAGIREARADCAAALAVAAGLGVTVAIGLFVSGLSSDMGRQLLPLVAATIVFAAKMGEWLCRRALARRQPGAAD